MMRLQQPSNNISGTIEIVLGNCAPEDQYEHELVACLYGYDLGCDDAPSVTLFTRKPGSDGCHSLWILSVAKLRALCDFAESANRVGSLQWDEALLANGVIKLPPKAEKKP
jgi:hypothetical protein